MFEDENGKE
jgi:hypothetical protein